MQHSHISHISIYLVSYTSRLSYLRFGVVNYGLLPMISAERGWSAAQGAAVLGSFAIGYVPVQIPSSLLARQIGEKLMITIDLLVNGLGCFLIAPAAALSPTLLGVLLATMGALQGCRVPAISVFRYMYDACV